MQWAATTRIPRISVEPRDLVGRVGETERGGWIPPGDAGVAASEPRGKAGDVDSAIEKGGRATRAARDGEKRPDGEVGVAGTGVGKEVGILRKFDANEGNCVDAKPVFPLSLSLPAVQPPLLSPPQSLPSSSRRKVTPAACEEGVTNFTRAFRSARCTSEFTNFHFFLPKHR